MLSPRLHNFVSYAGAALCFLSFSKHPTVFGSTACTLWVLHFARRCLETVFLFKFSSKVVPLADSVTEFIYYWAFAAWISTSIPTNVDDASASTVGITVWALAELFNFVCHVKLAMNASNKKSRLAGFPLFSYVTMPHYFFEVLSWVGFNMTLSWQCLASEVFMCVGALIMTCWAVQKHEAYGSRETPHTPIFPLIDIRPPRAVVDALAK
jgi:very-long-chain enoyl-CoA reductase